MKLIQANKDEVKFPQTEDLKEKLDGSTILFPMFRALMNDPGFSGSERDHVLDHRLFAVSDLGVQYAQLASD